MTHLSPAQEEFLLKHPHMFAYLIKLHADMTPEKIAAKYGLSARATDKYLMALEKAELIKVTGKLKVKPAIENLSLGHQGLAKAYYQALIHSHASFFIKQIGGLLSGPREEKVSQGFTMHAGRVRPETYTRFTDQFNQVLKDLLNASKFESKTSDEKDLKTFVLSLGYLRLENDHPHLDAFEDVFGKVIPI